MNEHKHFIDPDGDLLQIKPVAHICILTPKWLGAYIIRLAYEDGEEWTYRRRTCADAKMVRAHLIALTAPGSLTIGQW